ncbi:MAG TPA: hypothetical protein VFZ67_10930 [Nitrososphaera sp.]
MGQKTASLKEYDIKVKVDTNRRREEDLWCRCCLTLNKFSFIVALMHPTSITVLYEEEKYCYELMDKR